MIHSSSTFHQGSGVFRVRSYFVCSSFLVFKNSVSLQAYLNRSSCKNLKSHNKKYLKWGFDCCKTFPQLTKSTKISVSVCKVLQRDPFILKLFMKRKLYVNPECLYNLKWATLCSCYDMLPNYASLYHSHYNPLLHT